MKKLLCLLVIFIVSNSLCSQNLNGYKYALVPSKFDSWKEADRFRLSTLTKLYMQKYGFETYLDNETAPYDFVNSNCNEVFVDVVKDNGLFLTRLRVVLKDCNGKVLFTSKDGTSKVKNYKAAYSEALREAFSSFETLHYKYDPSKAVAVEKQINVASPTAVEPKAVVQESAPAKVAANPDQLYAQPIANGFQLVNSEPKVVMRLYKTSVPNIYTAFRDNTQGVLVSKNEEWFFEYYQNDKLISEKIAIKF